jgi:hypothetical protein
VGRESKRGSTPERGGREGRGVAFGALALKIRVGRVPIAKKDGTLSRADELPPVQRGSKTASKGAGNGSLCPGI